MMRGPTVPHKGFVSYPEVKSLSSVLPTIVGLVSSSHSEKKVCYFRTVGYIYRDIYFYVMEKYILEEKIAAGCTLKILSEELNSSKLISDTG